MKTGKTERIKQIAPQKIRRALNLASEKGSSAWLTVLPLHDLGFKLNKMEFRDDWHVDDIPSTCACGDVFTVDFAN